MDIREYSPIKKLSPDIWIWRENILYYQGIKLTPILEIYQDSIFLYLDFYQERQFSKLLKILNNSSFEFYLVTKELNDPKIKSLNWVDLSVEAYFMSLINHKFYHSYQKLNFDPIKNLLNFVKKWGTIELLWTAYDQVLLIVDQQKYDYITGTQTYKIWEEEIRDNFKGLKRDLQLQLILNK